MTATPSPYPWRRAAVRVWRGTMDTPAYNFGCRVLNMSTHGATPREIHNFAKANPPCAARGHRCGCPRYCPSRVTIC